MSHNQVILLLGTNLGDKNLNLKNAQNFIGSKIGDIIKMSEILETRPVDFDSDNNFLNQTIWILTLLSPIQLLHEIKLIEKEMGRIYTKNRVAGEHEDRIIDIDILIFNNLEYKSKSLILPHHQIFSRNFVKKLL